MTSDLTTSSPAPQLPPILVGQANVSQPDTIVGFNPFQRAPEGDISVQVDRRITATMHAYRRSHNLPDVVP